jgi:hypothetical protein
MEARSERQSQRPAKGLKKVLSIFQEALNQKITIEERGKSRIITVQEGIVRRLVAAALKGDLKATAFILAKEPEISRYIDPKVQINAKDMSPEEGRAEFTGRSCGKLDEPRQSGLYHRAGCCF